MKNISRNTRPIKMLPIIITLAILSFGCDYQMNVPEESQNQIDNRLASDSLAIGEPIQYGNLQIFPIVSLKAASTEKYIPLTKAIEKEFVELKETGNVNQLSITNKSDQYVFILAGDIVKGGKQDRTIGNDVIIAPHSRNIPLEAYCVESGRWQSRNDEAVHTFSENSKVLASNELKLASRYKKDQSEVWSKVAEKQEKLNRKLSQMEGDEIEVRSANSETSLQLALESKELEKYIEQYNSQLELSKKIPAKSIGFVYAINNKIYGADMYTNTSLFKAVQDKLLEAVIIEAIADADSLITIQTINSTDISEFIHASDSSEFSETKINSHTATKQFDSDSMVMFETINTSKSDEWIRKNYISKTDMDEKDNPIQFE